MKAEPAAQACGTLASMDCTGKLVSSDFLLELTDKPREWQGDGSGEKGYFYGDRCDNDEWASGTTETIPFNRA
jgi:hypothetical protein